MYIAIIAKGILCLLRLNSGFKSMTDRHLLYDTVLYVLMYSYKEISIRFLADDPSEFAAISSRPASKHQSLIALNRCLFVVLML